MSAEAKLNSELTTSQLDYRKGKSAYQSKTVLRMQATRRFLIANPGSTSGQISAACPNGCSPVQLQSRGYAYFTGGGKNGPAKWFARAQ